MNLESLAKRFIVNDDWLKDHLEALTSKLLQYCVIELRGQVHITNRNLTAKQRVMLVLVARMVASQLDANISGDVSVREVGKSSGLPENQVRARATDWISAGFAESPKRGVFRAVPHKVEDFLDSLSKEANGDDN